MHLLHSELTGLIIRAFYDVYNEIGPGFNEAPYSRAMAVALQYFGVPFEREVRYPIVYRGVEVGIYRADLVVADTLIVELKCADRISREHIRQTLFYLKASHLSLGLLLNFGITPETKRVVR
jgi:GxxExxY protein